MLRIRAYSRRERAARGFCPVAPEVQIGEHLHMELTPGIVWRGGLPLDHRLVPLLRAIRVRRTLRAAVDDLGLSYRSAWGLLAAQAAALGTPLVLMERGRGTRLSALGERLVHVDDAARRALDRPEFRIDVRVHVRGAPAAGARRLRIVASHDPLVVALLEREPDTADVAFKGSVESLQAFVQGRADLAGFHASVTGDDDGQTADMLGLLHPRRHRLVRFAAREQGLMLAPGNPHDIRSIADVARGRRTFVNRQRGSGTRMLLDRLLADHGIAPRQLRGYGTEEFTHFAVAATVAAGRADAGLGLKAVARQFGLDFVPAGRERYWFAFATRAQRDPALAAFVERLRGPDLQRLARRFAGYDARGAGEVVAVDRASIDA